MVIANHNTFAGPNGKSAWVPQIVNEFYFFVVSEPSAHARGKLWQ
jgi:hypothetical protein